MANWQRDVAKERFWRSALARQAAGGLSVRAFCQRQRLAETAFYFWRRTLANRDAANAARFPEGTRTRPSEPAADFVPLTVLEPGPRETSFTIELAGGRVLRLPPSITAERLAEVVRAMEGLVVPPRGAR